jgi:hypothetical protein
MPHITAEAEAFVYYFFKNKGEETGRIMRKKKIRI